LGDSRDLFRREVQRQQLPGHRQRLAMLALFQALPIVGNSPEIPLQKAFGNPACFKIALASDAETSERGTVKVRPLIGLYQIS
jgi:hypothetical protein